MPAEAAPVGNARGKTVPAEKDTLFGTLAVERGYLTQAQLDEAREAQRIVEQTGVKLPLSQVLVGKKLLTEDQAQDLDREVAVQTGEARLVAGYEVIAKIGQGGMGAVYKAKKLDTGESVALKILLPSLATPEYVKRFERESEVVRKLHHDNIVSCVEFGRDPKRKLYFCALELVEGEDVDKRVNRLGVLGETRANVAWSDLTPAQEGMLARKGGWEVEGEEGAVVRAVLARSRGDLDAARAALEEAGDHLLAAHYLARVQAAGKEAAYEKAVRLARSHARAKRWKEAVKVLEEAGIREGEPPGEPAVPGDGSAGASPSHVALLAEAKKLLAEAWSHIPPDPTLTLDLGPRPDGRPGNVTMAFVYIKPGVFMMGGNEDPKYNWQGVEKPKHEVAITRGFYIGRYELTRGQFAAFVRATGHKTEAERAGSAWARHPDGKWKYTKGVSWLNPMSFTQTDDHPVICVTWNDTKAFCGWLSKKSVLPVRLPTEAEWEYACRAGSTTRYCFGDSEGGLGEYAWYNANSNWQTHPVGQKRRNTWGFHDMHGNVWEWVADRYGEDYYANSPRENPTGPDTGSHRILRGGAWTIYGDFCRSAFRTREAPSHRPTAWGFRAAVSASLPGK